jgi:hypothetical protein
MTNNENFFAASKDRIQDYIQDRIALAKLQVLEKVSRLLSALISGLLILVLGFFILLFFGLTGGYFFAQITGSLFLGFAIMFGIFVLLFILLLVYRKKIIYTRVTNFVIDIFFDKNEIEDDAK